MPCFAHRQSSGTNRDGPDKLRNRFNVIYTGTYNGPIRVNPGRYRTCAGFCTKTWTFGSSEFRTTSPKVSNSHFVEIVTRGSSLSLTRRTWVVMGSSSGLILVINSPTRLLGPAERVCRDEQYREQASCPRSK